MAEDDPEAAVGTVAELERLVPVRRYRQLFASIVISILAVSAGPLLIVLGMSFRQHDREVLGARQMIAQRALAAGKGAVERHLTACSTSLALLVQGHPASELAQPERLAELRAVLVNFHGGLESLEVVDIPARGGEGGEPPAVPFPGGVRIAVGGAPTPGQGPPRFSITAWTPSGAAPERGLRASFDIVPLERAIEYAAGGDDRELLLVDRDGILQTPSPRHGDPLDANGLELPPRSAEEISLGTAAGEEGEMVGIAGIADSPFELVLVDRSDPGGALRTWRWGMLLFGATSILIVLAVVVMGSKYMIGRIRHGDRKRAAIFHNLEYTNKMEAIGRLGAGVAHEINNPMAIINQQAGLLKDLLSSPADLPPRSELLRRIDAVLRAVERCSAITHRLLGFGQHMHSPMERIDLRQLAGEVLGFLDQGGGHQNIGVSFDVAEGLPAIHSDRGRLQQVFLNLLGNAFAAVEDGGRIQVTMLVEKEGFVTTHVEDDGVGIAEEDLGRVFEPFFTTKEGSGTGLGLSVTYGIVNRLGGKISVSSTLGQGTRFTVSLPVERT